MKHLLLYTLLITSLSSCISKGFYRYGGAYPNVQLPLESEHIGVLEPRGIFGNEHAKRLTYKKLGKKFGKCSSATLLTENQLNEQGQLPAIFEDQLSSANIQWFMDHTDLDYLIYIDVGPGSLQDLPGSLNPVTADRMASVRLIVYDLADGGELKSITVNGTLNLKPDKRIWELESSEEGIGYTALKKALKRLEKFTNCR
ncbi:MAG: hypothetical protein ACJAZ9_001792 [Neolewinella sp.]